MAETERRATREIDVQKVASLARLTLGADEVERFAPQLRAVLGYITQLDEVDTGDAEMASDVPALGAPLRDDAVVPGLARDEALSQAPRSAEGAFVVPKFVDGT